VAEAQGTEWGIGSVLFWHHNLTPLIPLSLKGEGEDILERGWRPLPSEGLLPLGWRDILRDKTQMTLGG